MTIVTIAMVCGLIAVLYGVFTSQQVLKSSPGNEKMQSARRWSRARGRAYLGRQYTAIAIVGVVVAVILAVTLGALSTVSFLIGAVLSGVAGYVGMNISVRANVRTAEAARNVLRAEQRFWMLAIGRELQPHDVVQDGTKKGRLPVG